MSEKEVLGMQEPAFFLNRLTDYKVALRLRRVGTVLCVLLSLLLLGCDRGRESAVQTGGANYVDTLMAASAKKGLEAIDSLMEVTSHLEAAGILSSAEADYCRGTFYYIQNNEKMFEYYLRKALRDDVLYQRNPRYYFSCLYNLTTILQEKNAFNEMMRLSLTALERLKDQEPGIKNVYQGLFRMMVGLCQLRTGLVSEGLATAELARADIRDCYKVDTTNINRLIGWFSGVTNMALIMSDMDGFDYGPWLDDAEEAFHLLEKRPDCPDGLLEICRSHVLSLRSTYYAERGQKAEAAKAFEEFLNTKLGQTQESVLDKLDYYKKARLWQEAADLIPSILVLQNGYETEPSLDNLNILADCYQIARRTGHEQESQALADTIALLVDSVRQYHQRRDAAELGIIYDTEQKDLQIERQRWENRRQQWEAAGIVLLLIIVFLFFYGRFRQRSVKMLKVANDKLKEAHNELQLRHDELQTVHEKAEEASRMKAMFIQQISHEIRTPLNILSGYTQIIATPDIQLEDKERRSMVRKITDNTDRITQLINKMLELSEAGSQTVIEKSDNVTVAEIAVQAIDVSGIRLAPHLEFSLSYTSEELTTLTTNLRYAVKALVMLLDNAMKFTRPAGDGNSLTDESQTDESPEKKEKVRLIVGASDGFVTFTVEDTGCGVPSGEAEHIFEEFVQLDEFYEGTGIGLSVARSIARRLGGDITLDTAYFHGARFVMTLAI